MHPQLYIELKLQGRNVLIGFVYNPPGILGLPIYQPILEDPYPQYSHSIFLGDLNTISLANFARALDLRQRLENVSLTMISKDPTNFTAASPTLLDICATCEPDSIQMFSQISLPEMHTDHDLINGA
jgi:hypothetical protein